VSEKRAREESAADTDSEAAGGEEGGATAPGPCLAALFSSLATVAAEKLQSEAKFLADKRRMKKERDELVALALEDPGGRRQAEHQVRALQLELDSAQQAAARGMHQLQEQSITEMRA